jgi:hypothetical protein
MAFPPVRVPLRATGRFTAKGSGTSTNSLKAAINLTPGLRSLRKEKATIIKAFDSATVKSQIHHGGLLGTTSEKKIIRKIFAEKPKLKLNTITRDRVKALVYHLDRKSQQKMARDMRRRTQESARPNPPGVAGNIHDLTQKGEVTAIHGLVDTVQGTAQKTSTHGGITNLISSKTTPPAPPPSSGPRLAPKLMV